MASFFPSAPPLEVDEDDFNERFLTCTICLEPYQEAPKLLPCLHSFCSNCLRSHSRGNSVFKCPVCRRDVPVPQQGVDGFPNNIYVRDLKEFLAAQPRRSAVLPASSLSAAVPIVTQRERRQNASQPKINKQVSSNFLKRTAIKLRLNFRSKTKRYCSYHAEKELKLYCETCQLIVCKKCVKIEHSDGHFIMDIHSAAESRLQKLGLLLNEAKSHIEPLQISVQTVGEEVRKLRARKEELKQDINDTFNDLAQAVETQRNVCMAKLTEAVQGKEHALNTQYSELDLGHSTVRSGCQFAHQTIQDLRESDYEIVAASNQLAARLEELVAVRGRHTAEPVDNACLSFVLNEEDIAELRQIVSRIGEVHQF
ncbi:tripartite motif-containing protein 3-like [Saccoglossus kowalevskii]|uniref:Tripartite motif-containing protein 3-like n=1 Tax=Saccoglossus kowalevskii TaxID=10224 RepID=A0ABM0MNI8_SACKO|nr:PREDICTED: tripartite motif-containing protein 3-like [Saccoglossus kowalevskii]